MHHPLREPFRLASLALLVLATAPRVASAQAELDGSFIDYVAVGSNGTMLGSGSRSMRYREDASDAYSCDVWSTDTKVSSFTVVADADGILSDFAATNDNTIIDGFVTTSATASSGRDIRWSGFATSGLLGAGAISVSHTYSFEYDDRVMVQTVTLRNSGFVEFENVFFMVHGDPDHGRCGVGSSNATANDVIRQPASGRGALAVASTIPSVSPRVVLGMGTFSSHARADFSSGISDTDAVEAWLAPSDPGGVSADRGMSLVLRFEDLPVGQSVSFKIFYVWGSSVESVTDRFDAFACSELAEGSSCASAGATGTCHAGACCTGCWNGSACAEGSAVAECGVGGAACATCGDGSFCTTGDSCAAGVCTVGTAETCDDALACTSSTCDEAADRCVTSVTSGGCAVDGLCVAAGESSAADACLVCAPGTTALAWTASASCDADGDGVPNDVESPGGVDRDTDGDGVPDRLDPDDDGDGIPTSVERVDEAALGGDVDADGTPAYLDVDSDGDGSLDSTEGRTDANGNGRPDYLDASTQPADTDGDGVPDDVECSAQPCMDTDGDGIPDIEDTDDDGDGIPTSTERETEILLGGDIDGDGIPAYLDDDSDGDGILDRDEIDGDSDGDGRVDRVDGSDGNASGGRIVGGALCSASPTATSSVPVLALLVLALVLRARRRGAR